MNKSDAAANDSHHTTLHRVMPAEAYSETEEDDDGPAVRRFGREMLIWLVVVLGALALAGWKACESGMC